MKTKLLLLALVLLSSVMAWAQDFVQDGVNYYIDGEEAYIEDSPDATGDITILDKITVDGKDYPVTRFAEYAFYNNENITSVDVPNSVEYIGGYTFSYCYNLITVTIGSGITHIGGDAFYQSQAITDVYISADPEALEWQDWGSDDFNRFSPTICHVDNAALWFEKFSHVNILFRDPTTIPFGYTYDEATHTLTISGTEAMLDYPASSYRPWDGYKYDITTVVIEDGVPNIGKYAFNGCTSLVSVSIPSSVKKIGSYAFLYCQSLTSVNIPGSVHEISSSAFGYCTKLASVNFLSPSSLTSIENAAFEACKSLQTITLPATLINLSSTTFRNCNNLTAVNIDGESPYFMSYGGVLYVPGEMTLYYCPEGKASINFAPEVRYIGSYAFLGCSKLTSIVLPNTVEEIADYAFDNCTGLKKFNLPASVTYMNPNAFWGCLNLYFITVDKDNPNYKGVDGVVYSKDGTTLVRVPLAMTDIVIPDGVIYIEDYACQDCEKITSITIPNSVTTIGDASFNACANLKTVTFGSGVTNIEADAFYTCGKVTDIYCYADPNALDWCDSGYDDFNRNVTSVCHVFDADAFKAKWSTGDTSSDVLVNFQSDLLPQVTAEDLGDADLTTYYNSAENVKVDAGTTVYKVSFNGSQVTATEIEDGIINAGQGVMLKSDGKFISMATTSETSSADYSDNVLEGVDAPTSKAAGYKYYTLGQSGSELGFYEFLGAVPLPAHKAFIKSASGPAYGYKFDAATGISDLNVNDNLNGAIYNLSGQRLNKTQKGINIIGGKKVLVK